MDDVAAKAELMRFKGVGPKTVACVLMFTLARAEFPVDAHVVHVSPLDALPRATGHRTVTDCCKTDLHAATAIHTWPLRYPTCSFSNVGLLFGLPSSELTA
jgi:endonuclease-3